MKSHPAAFKDFYVLIRSVQRKLYQLSPPPMSSLILVEHLVTLDQRMGKCNLKTSTLLDVNTISELVGHRVSEIELWESLKFIESILTRTDDQICISEEFIEELLSDDTTPPIVIQEKKSAPSPSGKASHYQLANNLFGTEGRGSGYDYGVGNDIVKTLEEADVDLGALCAWRSEKKRPTLPCTIHAVKSELKIFLKPKDETQFLKPAKANPPPVYRKVNLRKGLENESN